MDENTYKYIILGAGPVGLLTSNILSGLGYNVKLVDFRPLFDRDREIKINFSDISLDNSDKDSDIYYDYIDEVSYNITKDWFYKYCKSTYDLLHNISNKQIKINALQGMLYDKCKMYIDNKDIINYKYTTPNKMLNDMPQNAIILDCMGFRTPIRDLPGFIYHNYTIEYALIITFSMRNRESCINGCKFALNRGMKKYCFIPSFDLTYDNEVNETHITIICDIGRDMYDKLRRSYNINLTYIHDTDIYLYNDINNLISNINLIYGNDHGTDFKYIVIPLNMYCTNNCYFSHSDKGITHHYFQVGDSCIGSPYFQSVTSGIELAISFCRYLNTNKDIDSVRTDYSKFVLIQKNKIFTRSLLLKQKKDIFSLISTNISINDANVNERLSRGFMF